MRRHIFFPFIMILSMLFLLAGCSDSFSQLKKGFAESSKAKTSLDSYLDSMNAISKKQNEIEENLTTHFINEDDFDKAYSYLTKSAIPQYNAFLLEVKSIHSTNSKINNIHIDYIKASQFSLDRLEAYKKGMDANDQKSFNQGNELLKSTNQLYQKYRDEMISYAKGLGIPLQYKEYEPFNLN